MLESKSKCPEEGLLTEKLVYFHMKVKKQECQCALSILAMVKLVLLMCSEYSLHG